MLYVGSQLLSSVLMSVTADRNQRFIMIALPFVFVPFIQGFPAGLLVYWITTNLWTVGQQYIIRRAAGCRCSARPGADRSRAGGGVGEGSRAAEKEKEKEKRRKARKAKPSANGDDAAPEREQHERRASAPPPPPRQRRKKKTGRRR